jgi:hypothetical protein
MVTKYGVLYVITIHVLKAPKNVLKKAFMLKGRLLSIVSTSRENLQIIAKHANINISCMQQFPFYSYYIAYACTLKKNYSQNIQ